MKPFESTYIEITSSCNQQCTFCPGTSRKKEFMTPDLFEHIARQLENKTRFIFFHVMGEPLLHPELDTLFDLSHRYTHRVNITTNGTLLMEKLLVLKEAPALRQVNISLHWLNEIEDHDRAASYMKDILTFTRETRDKKDYYITFRLWNMNEAGLNRSNRLAAEMIEKEFNLDYSITDTKATYKGLLLGKNIFLNHDTSFQWPDLKNPLRDEERFCLALRKQVALLVDGTVVPCCLDSNGTIALGNIKDQALENILQSPRARALYNGFSEGRAVEELCRHCGHKSLFRVKK